MELNEKEKRLKAAEYSKEVGVTEAAKFFNISRPTVYKGLKDLKNTDFPSDRIRRKQKRKKSARITDPKILKIFNNLVKDDGQNGLILKWTKKSIRGIKNELDQKGFNISDRGVRETLQKQNYSLQADKYLRDKTENVDIDDLMIYICKKAEEFISKSQPVISLFLKTFEFKYDKQNRVEHDYLSAWLGWKSIMKWWDEIGREYPSLKQLLICMDTNRGKCFYSKINDLWIRGIQKIANDTELVVTVCVLPQVTFKWEKARLCIKSKMVTPSEYQAEISIVNDHFSNPVLENQEQPPSDPYSILSNVRKNKVDYEESFEEWIYTIHPI